MVTQRYLCLRGSVQNAVDLGRSRFQGAGRIVAANLLALVGVDLGDRVLGALRFHLKGISDQLGQLCGRRGHNFSAAPTPRIEPAS
jgi:hypothetical protein